MNLTRAESLFAFITAHSENFLPLAGILGFLDWVGAACQCWEIAALNSGIDHEKWTSTENDKAKVEFLSKQLEITTEQAYALQNCIHSQFWDESKMTFTPERFDQFNHAARARLCIRAARDIIANPLPLLQISGSPKVYPDGTESKQALLYSLTMGIAKDAEA